MKYKLSLCTLASVLWLGATASAQVNLIAPDASWRYLDTGVDQGTAWRSPGFDDAAWSVGAGELGYGDGDEMTTIASGTSPTYYFRHKFTVANPGAFTTIALTLTYDDGAVVYVNGTEVYRTASIPAGAVAFSTLATTASDYLPDIVSVPASAFVAGENTIAVEVHQGNINNSDLSFNLTLAGTIDSDVPTLITSDPPAGTTVTELTFIAVLFSENVTGVEAADLLINSVPATGFTTISPREYQFTFPTPPTGAVEVAFAAGHGIVDTAPAPNAFAGGAWSYVFNPNLVVGRPVISEFLADNGSGIEDEEGTRGDWIEIFNPGPGDVNLGGWGLSDTATNLLKWRFPSMTLGANRYLLVFASEKNKTNALAPLHTNFKLGKAAGGYLALSDSFGNAVSVFASYPAQVTDKSYGRDRVDINQVGFFDSPTPGVQNTIAGTGYSAEPVFNYESGVYTNDSIVLTITAPAGAVIRYTVNGTEPTNTTSGTSYTGPITITGNTAIKARVFQTGLWPSPIKARNFIMVDSSLRNFSSNLPLVIITTPVSIPAGLPAGGNRARGTVAIIDTFRGRAAITGKPDYLGMAQFETFGQTSEGFPKKPHNIELNDEYGNDRKVSVLGMPAEADWKMRNPYSDKCLMNDFLAYEMFEQMGNYQCRRRLVEVFVNPTPNTKLTYTANYYGVLCFLEKIEAGRDRVNIAELTGAHTNEPAISGGYMFKRDKASPGSDLDFTTTNGTSFKMHEPKPKDLPGGASNPQVQWLRRYLSLYEAAAGAADWLTRTGTNHYSHYIDVDSFVDYHWINELPKQIDGYRISNYFSKDRNGKVTSVPIWDWNLSFGNADYLEGGRTNGWYYTQLGDGDHVFLRRLVGGTSPASGDPEFKQKIVDRWSVLRTNVMNVGRMTNRIDEIASMLSEAAARNYVKYQVLGTYLWPNPSGAPNWHVDYQHPTNYAGIISEMKKWTIGRYLWVDSQFVPGPVFDSPGGSIPTGTRLTINATNPIYYTLDGTDPRLPGNSIAPGAQLYSGPITINANARVFARARSATAAWGNTTWSGPTIGTFVVGTPKLVISEIMYNPAPAGAGSLFGSEEFEYLEVKNIGTTSLNLQRFRISGGLDFVFPAVSLNAGQAGVIVANPAAFESRYGSGRLILGQYTNRLANDGERLVLAGSVQEPILDFSYNDGWYPVTDGLGFSLVIADETAMNTMWNLKAGWKPSGSLYGSPSQENLPGPSLPAVVINEALTHTDLPNVDTIELLNTSGTPANIGNWYLSDDRDTPKKYRFPAGTTIPANGYWTVSEAQFNVGPNSFSLSSLGDEIYLFSADASGELTGYIHGFEFGAQANGVTFGRHVVSTGQDQFVAQATDTIETPNAGPLVGPLIISEVNYQPVAVYANNESWNNTEDEYLELSNISGSPVALSDGAGNSWRLRDAVEFTFPPGASIPAGGYAIVASVNPANATELAAFRSRNNIPAAVTVYGPWEGQLDNSGDSVELVRPDVPNPTTVPYILVDKVNYESIAPWPTGAGVGASMQRVAPSAYGNDPANWRFTVSTPGAPTPTGTAPVVTQQPGNTTALETRAASFTVAATGSPPIAYQWFYTPTVSDTPNPIFGATSPLLVLENLQLEQSGYYGCYVIGPGGVSSSALASLSVLPAAKVLENPRTVDVRVRPDPAAALSTNASLSVTVSSSNPPINYQWRFNGEDIPGANGSVYTIVGVTTNNYGEYSCAVTDANGTVFSQGATLYPLINPTLLAAPMAQTVPVNGLVGLSVQYGGFPAPFSVEWRQGSTPLTNYSTDKNIANFLFRAASSNATFNYRAVIKNRANQAPGLATAQVAITTVADADGDGIPDSVETTLGRNPNSDADAGRDGDSDGMSDYAETIAGTDPQDSASYLKAAASSTPGVVNVTFRAVAGRSYTIQYSDNLATWSKLGDVVAKATDRDETLTDATANPNRIYRISTPGQP